MHDQARDQFERLTDSVNRLAAAVEKIGCGHDQLGETLLRRYTRVQNESDLVSEEEMAAQLNLKSRTLAEYRRKGKLPGCWLRNGKRILYYIEETRVTWKRGLS